MQINPGQAAHKAIHEPAPDAAPERILALAPPTADEVVARAPALDKPRQVFRSLLQIRVKHEHALTTCELEAGTQGCVLAEVARQLDRNHFEPRAPRSFGRDAAQDGEAVVGRAVDHRDELRALARKGPSDALH